MCKELQYVLCYKPLVGIFLTMYTTSRTMMTTAMTAITDRAIVADLYASREAQESNFEVATYSKQKQCHSVLQQIKVYIKFFSIR